MTRASAIIVAAGSGKRLGFQLPKAFVQLAGQTLLAYSLRTISQVEGIDEVVVAAAPGMEAAARLEAQTSGIKIPVKVTAGGAERQDSVRIALALTAAESDVVVVHDAARPFAEASVFVSTIAMAHQFGAAIAAVAVADTLKRTDDGSIIATVPRAGLWQAQTPQAFLRHHLVEAHRRAVELSVAATDDAELVERIGVPVKIVEGSPSNLKITTPDDFRIAEALAASLFPR